MGILFYFFGLMAILSTLCVIFHHNPIYSLLYLIVSFLSISCDCFIVGASFAGSVEIIVYAGAIMVLFIFTIMMLNIDTMVSDEMKYGFFPLKLCICMIFLGAILSSILLYTLFSIKDVFIDLFASNITFKQIGIILFGPYMLIVELASFLLLGALVSVIHLSQEHELFVKFFSNQLEK